MHRFWNLAAGVEILALLLFITYMILGFSSPIKWGTQNTSDMMVGKVKKDYRCTVLRQQTLVKSQKLFAAIKGIVKPFLLVIVDSQKSYKISMESFDTLYPASPNNNIYISIIIKTRKFRVE